MSLGKQPLKVWIGFDPTELSAWSVACRSMRHRATEALDIRPLSILEMEGRGLYDRPTERRNGRLWDVISDAPMTTEHAITRFLIPILAKRTGWALFVDGDVLVRHDVAQLFALADDRYAVMVVKHDHTPAETVKKGGHPQTVYPRKNWSSVMLWNCAHASHEALDRDAVNTWTGRRLHGFDWLRDEDIGDLPPTWNYLVGVSPPLADPAIVHYTLGLPTVSGYEDAEFADDWRACRQGQIARRVSQDLSPRPIEA